MGDTEVADMVVKGTLVECERLLKLDEYGAMLDLLGSNITAIEELGNPYATAISLMTLYNVRASVWRDCKLNKRALEDIEKAIEYSNMVPFLQFELRDDILSQLYKQRDEINKRCFIATAVYGNAFAPEVIILRRFRDVKMKSNQLGRWMICVYDQYSPPIADWISEHPIVRLWVQRLVLSPIVWIVRCWTIRHSVQAAGE